MFALLLFSVAITANFESGSVGKVEMLSDRHIRCTVQGEVDQDKRNRQPSWFYFRLDGVAGRELTIDLTGFAGEYDYKPDSGDWARGMRPVYSYDNRAWRAVDHSDWDSNTATVRIRIKTARDRIWIARLVPYTNRRLEKLLDRYRQHPHFRESVVGTTVEGRPMRLLTITNPKVAEHKKMVMWLMARQHSWETGTSWIVEGALRYLLSNDRRAVQMRRECIFKVFPMVDPDGVFHGGVRFNRYGYDLNRNWDLVDAKLMPEINAHRKAILDWLDGGHRADLFVTLHNTDLDVQERVEGPLTDGGPTLRELARRIAAQLAETTDYCGSRTPRDTAIPQTAGRMTVYHALVHDLGIPALLIEQAVSVNPRIGRVPTADDCLEFGAGLVRAMYAAVKGQMGTRSTILDR